MNYDQQNAVVITEDDYNVLRAYVNSTPAAEGEMSLAAELKRAVVVKNDALPPYTIRLNSKVSVLDLQTQKVLEFTLVMPDKADITQGRVSILTPMGAALIGFRKAEEVMWKVPAGLKRFRILDVYNKP